MLSEALQFGDKEYFNLWAKRGGNKQGQAFSRISHYQVQLTFLIDNISKQQLFKIQMSRAMPPAKRRLDVSQTHQSSLILSSSAEEETSNGYKSAGSPTAEDVDVLQMAHRIVEAVILSPLLGQWLVTLNIALD